MSVEAAARDDRERSVKVYSRLEEGSPPCSISLL